jgi:glycosyltransferase involved in cell wall biosynthesis
MRIAQIAPLIESVPPQAYGGTERVVSYLTEELVRQGHDVTLFASGDSHTSAKLVPVCPRALRLDPGCDDDLPHHYLLLERVAQRARDFDILHFHIDYLHFPLSRRLKVPSITTLHGRLDLPDLQALYHEFREAPVVSISNSQREPLPQANFRDTIYHGLPLELHGCRAEPGDYFAFVGRVSPEKRVDRAIEIAKRINVPLKIAAKVDRNDLEYFKQDIEPMLEHPLIEFVGEIGEQQKEEFLGHARALLFPIDWPEPFGLVMIEAMACGTPSIAFRCGSVPEVIEDEVTGFVVDDIDAAVAAATRIGELDRRACRAAFERRFSAKRMASDYVRLYSSLVEEAWAA